MANPYDRGLIRLRVTPDQKPNDAFPSSGGRVKGSRRPHADAKVEQVRKLIEQTTLTYDKISEKSGVGSASICRWARDGGWQRPAFAPRATDTVPSERASMKLKQRKLAERLSKLAETHVRRIEQSRATTTDELMQALQVLKMARLEAMSRKRPRKSASRTETGLQTRARDEAIRNALKEMRRGGVDINAIPQDAMDLLVDAVTTDERWHPSLRARK